MENKIKHLELIQSIILRMASNSFALKGWAVTLVAGIFALASKDNDKMYFLVAYIPNIIFWGLDSYYLMLERKYRILYDIIRKQKDSEIDFNMDVNSVELKNNNNSYYNCLFSKSEILFYFPLALVTGGIVIITSI